MVDFPELFISFNLAGKYRSCESYGTSRIHDTFLLESGVEGDIVRYILQRLNTQIFRKPEALQDNLRRIEDYLRGQNKNHLPEGFYIPELIESKQGNNYLRDRFGSYWRCSKYADHCHTYDRVITADQAYEGARIFGLFIDRLKDYNARRLHITLPDHLNMEVRMQQLMIAQLASPEERMKIASDAFEMVLANQKISNDYIKMRHALPDRVTHNDARISKILFSRQTGRGLGVHDLDTVMTGTLLTDFGNMIRTFTAEGDDDERDPARMKSSPGLFEAVLNGFMSGVRGFISEVEKANLLLGVKIMIYMQAVLYLTDYLNGDVYYKIQYPAQNLDRAKNQLRLLESVLEQQDQFRRIMKKNS